MGTSAPTSIDLRHLRYFLAVIEELHFGRAAERVHISQPPLSQAIRKLEDALGAQLLHRTSRAVTPTEAGLVFAEEARKILASLELAVAETRRAAGSGASLRIGCTPHLPIDLVRRFLAALNERDERSRPEVEHLLALEQLRRLRGGELDLGIFHHAADYDEIEVEPIFAGEPLAAFLPPGHPLGRRKTVAPDDLSDEVLVMFPRTANPALHDRMLALIEAGGYRFRDVREATGANPRDVLLAVTSGVGVALKPASLEQADEAGTLVTRRRLDSAVSMPDAVLAWRANPPHGLQTVLADVREVARELHRASSGVRDPDRTDIA
jgi:DNA-binding transcriptional LysR family regulator